MSFPAITWLVDNDGVLPGKLQNNRENALYQTLYILRCALRNDDLSESQRKWLPQLREFPTVTAYLATDDARKAPFQDWIHETRGETLPVPEHHRKSYESLRSRSNKLASAQSDRIIAAYPESAMARDLIKARDAKALRIAPLRQLRGLQRLLDQGHAMPHMSCGGSKTRIFATGNRTRFLHVDTGTMRSFEKAVPAVEARQQGLVDIAGPVNWACGLSGVKTITDDDKAEFEALCATLRPRVRALLSIPEDDVDDTHGSAKRSRLGDRSCM